MRWQEIYSYDFSLSDISTSVRSSTTYSNINIGSPDIADLIKDYDDARLRLHITRMEYSAYGNLDYSDRMVGIGLGTSTSVPFWVVLPDPNITTLSHNIITDLDATKINIFKAFEYGESQRNQWYYGQTVITAINNFATARLGYKYFTLYSLTGTFYIEVK